MKTQQYCPALFCVRDTATHRAAGLMLITCRLIREYLLQTAVTRPYICLEPAEEKLMGTLAEVPSSPPPNLDKHQSPETLSSHTASATDKSSAVYWHRK